jgi:hypothetical protein
MVALPANPASLLRDKVAPSTTSTLIENKIATGFYKAMNLKDMSARPGQEAWG